MPVNHESQPKRVSFSDKDEEQVYKEVIGEQLQEIYANVISSQVIHENRSRSPVGVVINTDQLHEEISLNDEDNELPASVSARLENLNKSLPDFFRNLLLEGEHCAAQAGHPVTQGVPVGSSAMNYMKQGNGPMQQQMQEQPQQMPVQGTQFTAGQTQGQQVFYDPSTGKYFTVMQIYQQKPGYYSQYSRERDSYHNRGRTDDLLCLALLCCCCFPPVPVGWDC